MVQPATEKRARAYYCCMRSMHLALSLLGRFVLHHAMERCPSLMVKVARSALKAPHS